MNRIRTKGDPILSQAAASFDFAAPPCDPVRLGKDLAGVMLMHRALGLAAPQVGKPVRVFVMKVGTGWLECFNPEVMRQSGKKLGDEGCLSFPGQVLPIVRADVIVARWQNSAGEAHLQSFTGLLARVFQHELDHLDGKTIEDRVTPAGRALAAKQKMRSHIPAR